MAGALQFTAQSIQFPTLEIVPAPDNQTRKATWEGDELFIRSSVKAGAVDASPVRNAAVVLIYPGAAFVEALYELCAVERVPPPKRSIIFDAASLGFPMPILFYASAACVVAAVAGPFLLRLIAPRWARR